MSSDTPAESIASLIKDFNSTVQTLQQSYAMLQEKVAALDRELEEKNTLLTNILLSIPSGVMVMDTGGRIILMNKAAREMLLYDPPEIDALDDAHPVRALLLATLREGRSSYVHGRSMLTKQGLSVPVESRTSIIQNQASETAGAVEVFTDLSEMKRLEELGRQRDRLSALGEMSANVAHEIRNPIHGIQGFAKLLERDCAGDAAKLGLVKNILSGAEHLNKIVSSLLVYTKPVHLHLRMIDIYCAVLDAVESLGQEAGRKGQVIKTGIDIKECRIILEADALMIKQVFINLLQNALWAVGSNEKPFIAVRMKVKDGKAVVRVMDNGCGMDKATSQKVFDPFFTTRADGTGLGLPICRKIVNAHGGNLDVKSRRGRGTVFTMALPMPRR